MDGRTNSNYRKASLLKRENESNMYKKLQIFKSSTTYIHTQSHTHTHTHTHIHTQSHLSKKGVIWGRIIFFKKGESYISIPRGLINISSLIGEFL